MRQNTPEVRPYGHISTAIQAVQILKIKEVCDLTGLSRASIYRLAAIGQFPAPVKTGIRSSGFRLSDISNWAASRQTGIRLST